MNQMPPGAPNFQLPRPLQGVVYADDGGSIYLMRGGVTLLLWSPPKAMPVNQTDEEYPMTYPREVQCPVTGFRWLARTKAQARMRWAVLAMIVLWFATGFGAGYVWRMVG